MIIKHPRISDVSQAKALSSARLSRTLINRRLFVHRQRRKGILLPKAQPLTNTVKKDLSGLIYWLQINLF